MAKVIAVKTSMIDEKKSHSTKLFDTFLDLYKIKNPGDNIVIWNLNELKMAQISLSTKNFKEFWTPETSDKYINALKEADKFIIASPMTNFNYTATTKNFLDHILVANKTFSYKYSKKGEAIGLLNNLKAQVLTTQGAPIGWYPFGDHTTNFVGTLKFMGMKVTEPITVAGTKVGDNLKKTPTEMIAPHLENIKAKVECF